jgi:hypothetical protein
MFDAYLRFLGTMSATRVGRAGVILATSSFLTLVILQLAMLLGLVTNAYAGLLIYLLLPVLFVVGLLLVPLGWIRLRRRTGKSGLELARERFGESAVAGKPFGARIFRTIALMTLINVVVLGATSMRALHFMESARFCGTACHSVMNPEWVTYQSSPHARVPCVECHVGEGAGALIESKMRGAYQMISVSFDLLERPIPTPVHTLRPARETCEKCHWPEKFYGTRIDSRVRYGDDEASTPVYTTLAVKIDAGERGAESGVHWHIGEKNVVRYASVDDERREMIWVEARRPDGSVHRWENRRLVGEPRSASDERAMDCVDCHNRATHIYEDPEPAVDRALRLQRIDRRIPFIRREALRAIRAGYPDRAAAAAGIENSLAAFYRREYPDRFGELARPLSDAVDELRAIYDRNVHPGMKIGWGAYRSHLSHRTPGYGCFRCHGRDLVDEKGERISDDCTLCHSILANDSPDPFQYLHAPEEKARDRAMHLYLQEEFLDSEVY